MLAPGSRGTLPAFKLYTSVPDLLAEDRGRLKKPGLDRANASPLGIVNPQGFIVVAFALVNSTMLCPTSRSSPVTCCQGMEKGRVFVPPLSPWSSRNLWLCCCSKGLRCSRLRGKLNGPKSSLTAKVIDNLAVSLVSLHFCVLRESGFPLFRVAGLGRCHFGEYNVFDCYAIDSMPAISAKDSPGRIGSEG